MARIETKTKDGALAFLQKLKSQLLGDLPPVTEIRTHVDQEYEKYKQAREKAKNNGLPSPETCRSTPEAIFVDEYLIGHVSSALQSFDGMDKIKAEKALLYEFHRTTEHHGISTQTCSRSPRSPFTKDTLSMHSEEIFKYWSDKEKLGFDRASPDFCFRDPFPYKILSRQNTFRLGASRPRDHWSISSARRSYIGACRTRSPEGRNLNGRMTSHAQLPTMQPKRVLAYKLGNPFPNQSDDRFGMVQIFM